TCPREPKPSLGRGAELLAEDLLGEQGHRVQVWGRRAGGSGRRRTEAHQFTYRAGAIPALLLRQLRILGLGAGQGLVYHCLEVVVVGCAFSQPALHQETGCGPYAQTERVSLVSENAFAMTDRKSVV